MLRVSLERVSLSCPQPCVVEQGGSGKRAPQVEMGTQGKDEVDYDWLPPTTLAAQSEQCAPQFSPPHTHHTLPSPITPSPPSHPPLTHHPHPSHPPSPITPSPPSHPPLTHHTLPHPSHPPLTHHTLPHPSHLPSPITPFLTHHTPQSMQRKAPNPPPALGRERVANRRNDTIVVRMQIFIILLFCHEYVVTLYVCVCVSYVCVAKGACCGGVLYRRAPLLCHACHNNLAGSNYSIRISTSQVCPFTDGSRSGFNVFEACNAHPSVWSVMPSQQWQLHHFSSHTNAIGTS